MDLQTFYSSAEVDAMIADGTERFLVTIWDAYRNGRAQPTVEQIKALVKHPLDHDDVRNALHEGIEKLNDPLYIDRGHPRTINIRRGDDHSAQPGADMKKTLIDEETLLEWVRLNTKNSRWALTRFFETQPVVTNKVIDAIFEIIEHSALAEGEQYFNSDREANEWLLAEALKSRFHYEYIDGKHVPIASTEPPTKEQVDKVIELASYPAGEALAAIFAAGDYIPTPQQVKTIMATSKIGDCIDPMLGVYSPLPNKEKDSLEDQALKAKIIIDQLQQLNNEDLPDDPAASFILAAIKHHGVILSQEQIETLVFDTDFLNATYIYHHLLDAGHEPDQAELAKLYKRFPKPGEHALFFAAAQAKNAVEVSFGSEETKDLVVVRSLSFMDDDCYERTVAYVGITGPIRRGCGGDTVYIYGEIGSGHDPIRLAKMLVDRQYPEFLDPDNREKATQLVGNVPDSQRDRGYWDVVAALSSIRTTVNELVKHDVTKGQPKALSWEAPGR